MLKSKTVFGPEEVRVLGRAYAEAVQALELPPSPPTTGVGTPQHKVAQRIMRVALEGERDFTRLRAAGLRSDLLSAWAA
jgi:hypothetical protein